MRPGDRERFKALLGSDAPLRAATRDVVALFEAKFDGFVEAGDYVESLLEWPAELPGAGRLRERPAPKSARCRYAGCKEGPFRVYETRSTGRGKGVVDSWTLCFTHALYWRDYYQEKQCQEEKSARRGVVTPASQGTSEAGKPQQVPA